MDANSFADDKKPDGTTLNPPSNHYTHDRKPAGFNIKQVFISPSICYSGKTVYAPQKRYLFYRLYIIVYIFYT